MHPINAWVGLLRKLLFAPQTNDFDVFLPFVELQEVYVNNKNCSHRDSLRLDRSPGRDVGGSAESPRVQRMVSKGYN